LVSGLLIFGSGAEVVNAPLQHAVAFQKEADIIVTNHYWKAVVKIDLTPFKDTILLLRNGLKVVREALDNTTPIAELRSVETSLNYLSYKLATLQRFLPRVGRKRGLLDMGGMILKTLFGIATVLDINEIHNTLSEIYKRQYDIWHSVDHNTIF
jgi:hypothetical protein